MGSMATSVEHMIHGGEEKPTMPVPLDDENDVNEEYFEEEEEMIVDDANEPIVNPHESQVESTQPAPQAPYYNVDQSAPPSTNLNNPNYGIIGTVVPAQADPTTANREATGAPPAPYYGDNDFAGPSGRTQATADSGAVTGSRGDGQGSHSPSGMIPMYAEDGSRGGANDTRWFSPPNASTLPEAAKPIGAEQSRAHDPKAAAAPLVATAPLMAAAPLVAPVNSEAYSAGMAPSYAEEYRSLDSGGGRQALDPGSSGGAAYGPNSTGDAVPETMAPNANATSAVPYESAQRSKPTERLIQLASASYGEESETATREATSSRRPKVRVVEDYAEADLHGRGFPGAFPGVENSEMMVQRIARSKLDEISKRQLSKLPGEHISYDFYGRADPRIFGPDSHIASRKQAYARMLELRKASTGPRAQMLATPSHPLLSHQTSAGSAQPQGLVPPATNAPIGNDRTMEGQHASAGPEAPVVAPVESSSAVAPIEGSEDPPIVDEVQQSRAGIQPAPQYTPGPLSGAIAAGDMQQEPADAQPMPQNTTDVQSDAVTARDMQQAPTDVQLVPQYTTDVPSGAVLAGGTPGNVQPMPQYNAGVPSGGVWARDMRATSAGEVIEPDSLVAAEPRNVTADESPGMYDASPVDKGATRAMLPAAIAGGVVGGDIASANGYTAYGNANGCEEEEEEEQLEEVEEDVFDPTDEVEEDMVIEEEVVVEDGHDDYLEQRQPVPV